MGSGVAHTHTHARSRTRTRSLAQGVNGTKGDVDAAMSAALVSAATAAQRLVMGIGPVENHALSSTLLLRAGATPEYPYMDELSQMERSLQGQVIGRAATVVTCVGGILFFFFPQTVLALKGSWRMK